jgi:hypothetical protein
MGGSISPRMSVYIGKSHRGVNRANVNHPSAFRSVNPCVSVQLKINKLLKVLNPLSGPVFVFEMSNMQFCEAEVRAVSLKPTDWESVFRSAKEEFCRPWSVRPLLNRRTESHTGRRADWGS